MTLQNSHVDQIDQIDKKDMFEHVESAGPKDRDWIELRAEANRDEEWQHSLTLLQSLRIYKTVGVYFAYLAFS